MSSTRSLVARSFMWAAVACAATGLASTPAAAEALLVIEADSGKVLYAHNAGQPWYPASVTKLMTAYVTLRAVEEGRISLDKPLTVSATAAAQSPVKMGFPPGTIVTVDNALKMLMVKSANDMAVVLAEGVAGSVENFADEMNGYARRLGMIQSSFVNPNGLPADDQIVSARDMAILARALIREFPEYDYYWHLPGIRLGKMVQRNYNTLLGRYPGADGMKTGFICASGFNLVASATRDNRRLIAVVLGAPSAAVRAVKAAQLLERGFSSSSGLSWLMPSLGTVDTLQPVNVDPPNLREEMCGKNRKRPAAENEDDTIASDTGTDWPQSVFMPNQQQQAKVSAAALLMQDVKLGDPVLVFTGTKPPAPGAQAAVDSKSEKKKPAKPAAKDAGKDAPAVAAAPSGENAAKPKPKPKPPVAKDGAASTAAAGDGATKPKPKPPAPKDGAASIVATGDGATKPKPKPPAPKDTAKDGAASAAAAGDGATKPKPKPPAPPKDAAKDGAAPAAAAGDTAAPKPKPKKPKPAPTDLTPTVEKTSHVQ
jgi:D-alanyl-D-alanine carboxypeptidase